MSRSALSKPLQQAYADGLLEQSTLFDYGCGRGDDLRTLAALGIEARGWDPSHFPDSDKLRAGGRPPPAKALWNTDSAAPGRRMKTRL